VVLISLSKHTKKDFQIITVFEHSAFIVSQSMFVPTNMMPKRYLACRRLSKCQLYSQCCQFSHEFGLVFLWSCAFFKTCGLLVFIEICLFLADFCLVCVAFRSNFMALILF